ncbi:MAG: glycosyltransferase family 2 protein [Nocardioides sp.]
MIGAVVPVHNRRGNLALLLTSLEQQTNTDFHLVVADDGSTDGTRDLVEARARGPIWCDRLSWVGCGPNQGVRTGRARNIGAANLDPGTQLLVMLDSDLVLQPTAMDRFADVHAQHPSRVLLGLVEWLPPLEADAIQTALVARDIDGLRAQVPQTQPERLGGTFTGPELRAGLTRLDPDQELPLRPEWALPLNSAWPVDLYWQVGGFDETMNGYGYQDMEFGARAAKAGAKCLARPDLWALHVWHSKPPKAMVENQRNLGYYLRRHGSNKVIETDIDWTLWWHYHADLGGTVAQVGEFLWAVSGDRQHRLFLPDPTWLIDLGHCPHAAQQNALEGLQAITDHGTAAK